MKIPRQFTLGALPFDVQIVDDLVETTECVGQTCVQAGRMVIQAITPETPMTPEGQCHVFLHELVHAILGVMNEHRLNRNERFVDMFALLLHQALETME